MSGPGPVNEPAAGWSSSEASSSLRGSPWAQSQRDPYQVFTGPQDDDVRPSPLAPLVVILDFPLAILFWGGLIWAGWRLFH